MSQLLLTDRKAKSQRGAANLNGVGHAIIEVPAMAGDPSHAAADGPAMLTGTLADAGCRLDSRRVSVPPFGGDVQAASLAVCRRVAEQGQAIVAEGSRPVVLAGSCDVAPGVLAGARDPGCGVVWIDAHADFNTPSSSARGFWPGMTLAVVVGDCGEEVWSALEWRPVVQERVALFGVRSLSPAEEARRLERSAVHVVRWQDGLPQGNVETTLDRLAEDIEGVYVHLDLDALDPAVGSGVVDPPVPGGISPEQLAELIGQVRDRFAVIATTIATYTPSKDDGSTLTTAIAAIQRLIDGAP
jgi:arginase